MPLLPGTRSSRGRPRSSRAGRASSSGRTSCCRARIPRCRRGSASSREAGRRPPAPSRAAVRRCCRSARVRLRMRGSACANAVSRPYFTSSRTSRHLRVIAVLLAAARVAAGRLQVAEGVRADPDIGPRRRNRQRPDALELGGVLDGAAATVHVAEVARFAETANRRGRSVVDIAEPGDFCRGKRTDRAARVRARWRCR